MTQYEKGKANAEEKAKEWQRTTAQEPMSWGEVAYWCEYFTKLGKRYGLIKEFRINGII